ncbi:MAG: ATP-binding cassette domain-containing protein [Bacteroidales bacterium]|nr:ATP-binding cassette domain-containing protein [Bacteroidales bacterium]
MSEKIIETLMQLFALIAKPQRNESERRNIVEAFLGHLLNQELVKKYLSVYNESYREAAEKLARSTPERREGAIAIRITKLCKDINEERQLDQEQRVVVVIKALEFCKSGDGEISPMEMGFIDTLADGLGIGAEEFETLKKFVINPFSEVPVSPNMLVISGQDDQPENRITRHLRKEMLKGQIWILFVQSVGMYFMKFSRSGELSMNGQLLQENTVYPVSQGSSIKGYKISPIYYWDITMQFLKEEFLASRVVYEVNNLEYRFRTGEVGIHHMSFKSESGRMVGIMGASGAGKSTLLSVLNGINAPCDGEVLINGISIHKEKEKIKGLIGFVSQDDLLIEELTVFENLYYNARLCFGNLSEEEIEEKVDNVLKSLGLYEIRNMKVGTPLNKKISGGQRKRLNISLELIREPAIMFLDEPTSGLSSRDSENILDLLKELARKGKLLFVVIHQPSSDIFKMFDKLIILDTGGFMIYNGNPVDSIEYFKKKIGQADYSESECHSCGNVNPEQIFNIVETKVFTESGKPTATRRISPDEWRKLYESERKEDHLEKGGSLPEINFRTPSRFRQFMVFAQRDILSKAADLQYVLITFLEAPVLAFFLAYLIRYFDESAKNPEYTLMDNSNLPVYLFMSVIVAIFMGLTVSAEEIIKDRKILKRESFLNLSWNSYLVSKVLVQFGISAVQALTFVLIGNGITGIKGMTFEYWLVLFSCWASANMLGLVISDSFKTVVTIYILIPFLVIPQIILSGVMVKFEKLNPRISSPVEIPWYGEMITARWGYEALAVRQYVSNRYEKYFYEYDKDMSIARYKKDYWNSKLKGKLDLMMLDLEKGSRSDDFNSNLKLVSNEISKELEILPGIRFDNARMLTPEQITPKVIDEAIAYVESVRRYYVRFYNEANSRKDKLITQMEEKDKEGFQKLRNDNSNVALEEFVTAKNETQKIIEFRNELVQKLDPVFMDPEPVFVRAHFYSPTKQLFGRYADTFIINVAVIWFMTFILYLVLYFRLLNKLLIFAESLFGKKHKGSDKEVL